jgi:hypothetical protein
VAGQEREILNTAGGYGSTRQRSATGQGPLSTKEFLLSMVCLGKRSVERGAGDFEEVGNALAVAVALVD